MDVVINFWNMSHNVVSCNKDVSPSPVGFCRFKTHHHIGIPPQDVLNPFSFCFTVEVLERIYTICPAGATWIVSKQIRASMGLT